ncbi:MAG: hypothetical protein WAV56_02315 [Microgenomates group bacterium]
MSTKQEELAKRLLYLSLDLHEKVLLWLAYRGLKPVSEITVERRNLPQLRRLVRQGKKIVSNYDKNSLKIKRIRKWIHDAGLFYATEPRYPSCWHIGRDKDKVKLSAKILRRFDYESEYQSGILFGFPKKSAEAYAYNRISKLKNDPVPMVRPGGQSLHSYLRNKYYLPYIFFAIRADRIKEDSQVAKVWADTIRQEVPILAKWFEKSEFDRRKKEARRLRIEV